MVEALNLTINQEFNGLKMNAMVVLKQTLMGTLNGILSFSCVVQRSFIAF